MCVTICVTTTLLLMGGAVTGVRGLDNGVGLTPSMGWGTWNLFGCWGRNWTGTDIVEMADAMVGSGMKEAGYRYINLDAGWQGGRRVDGTPFVDPTKFPNGIEPVIAHVHKAGLLFGIYRDRREGFGHETADARQYADWGCDYVKNDGYGNNTDGLSSSEVYGRFRDAVNATGRAMVLNIKFDVEPRGFSSAAEIANSWRVARDVRPVWADVVRVADVIEPLAHLSHAGGFGDMDALEVGVPAPIYTDELGAPCGFCPSRKVISGRCQPTGRNVTMTVGEQKTMMAIWAIANSMLIAGNDLRTMTDETKSILTAAGPISVNQDPLLVAGRRIRLEPTGQYETWAKPLEKGAFAVLLWSRNESCLANDDTTVHEDPTPQIFWDALGFTGPAEVFDLWTGDSYGSHADNWPKAYSKPTMAPHASQLVKVVPSAAVEWATDAGEHRPWKCPAWGCHVQGQVQQGWAERTGRRQRVTPHEL